MSDLLEPLEALAEEMLLKGQGQPVEAGLHCDLCGWEKEVPWALRDQLEGLAEEHALAAHPDVGPDDEDEDDDEEDDD